MEALMIISSFLSGVSLMLGVVWLTDRRHVKGYWAVAALAFVLSAFMFAVVVATLLALP